VQVADDSGDAREREQRQAGSQPDPAIRRHLAGSYARLGID
jgi:hypothetical protein